MEELFDSSIRNSESLALFKKHILSFIRASVNSTFHFYNPKGSTLPGLGFFENFRAGGGLVGLQ